jgi:hypothetical protein
MLDPAAPSFARLAARRRGAFPSDSVLLYRGATDEWRRHYEEYAARGVPTGAPVAD